MEPPDKNQYIKTLYNCGIKKPESIHRLITRAGVKACLRTVQRKVEILNGGGDIEEVDNTNRGRPLKLTEEDKMEIEEMLEENPTLNSVQVVSHGNFNCSPRTMRNYLKAMGYKWKSVRPIFELEEKHTPFRFEFAKNHLSDDWQSTVFIDESTFRLYSSVGYCYQK